MTVFDLAKKFMSDNEMRSGSYEKNERKYLDAVGFDYLVEDGEITGIGDDLYKFYDAMNTLVALQYKYKRRQYKEALKCAQQNQKQTSTPMTGSTPN